MAGFFFDSSALLKKYIREDGTPRVLELIESGERLVVSSLAFVEVASTVVRRAKGGDIKENDLGLLLTTLEDEFRMLFDVIELGRATITRSVDLVRIHGLRAANSIQLACALMAAGGSSAGRELIFVSSDVELNAAAEKEGLTVLDPQQS